MASQKRASIEDLLEFLNSSSIEPNLAWIVPHLYNKKVEYEVLWIYDKTEEFNFHIRQKGQKGAWKGMTASDLVKMMTIEKVDLSNFEFQLLRVICIQAVCSHYYIERSGELIGKEKIEEAIKLITTFTKPEEKEDTSCKTKIPRLKLVDRKKKKKKKDDDKI